MTKAKVNQAIRQTVLETIKRAGYDLQRTQISYFRGGLFISSSDIDEINRVSNNLLSMLRTRAARGDHMTREQIEHFIDSQIATFSYLKASGDITIDVAAGSNPKEHVREAKDAIVELKRLDPGAAAIFEKSLKAKIGEE